MEHVEIGVREYRAARARGSLFIVAPGHEQPELERVVADCPGYRVVALRPAARRLLAAEAG